MRASTRNMYGLFVTQHALERYCEHFPGSAWGDVQEAIALGTAESPEFIQALTARKNPSMTDTYVMSSDKRGVFVIADGRVITYLRLGVAQQRILQAPKALPSYDPDITRLANTANVNIHQSVGAVFAGAKDFKSYLRKVTAKEHNNLGLCLEIGGHSVVAVWNAKGSVTIFSREYRRSRLGSSSSSSTERLIAERQEKYERELHERYRVKD